MTIVVFSTIILTQCNLHEKEHGRICVPCVQSGTGVPRRTIARGGAVMIKRITSSVLALCLTLTLLLAGVWAASPTSGQWADLSWSYDSAARTLTISGAGAMPDVPTINASPFRR